MQRDWQVFDPETPPFAAPAATLARAVVGGPTGGADRVRNQTAAHLPALQNAFAPLRPAPFSGRVHRARQRRPLGRAWAGALRWSRRTRPRERRTRDAQDSASSLQNACRVRLRTPSSAWKTASSRASTHRIRAQTTDAPSTENAHRDVPDLPPHAHLNGKPMRNRRATLGLFN